MESPAIQSMEAIARFGYPIPAPSAIAAARLRLGYQTLSPKKCGYGVEQAGLCCGRHFAVCA